MTKRSDDIHMTPKSWTLHLTEYLIEEKKQTHRKGIRKLGARPEPR